MRTITITLFTVLTYFSFGQQRVNHFESTYFEQQRFAHRGGYAIGPENTLQTILLNLYSGVNAIEIDVHLTKDNELILFHDYTVNRLLDTDSEKAINEFTLEELKHIPLRDSSQGVQYVCSLAELIDTLVVLVPARETLNFLLEVDFKPNGKKTKAAVNALLDILAHHSKDLGERIYNYFFISTFYPNVLKEIQRRDPKIKTAFAVNNVPNEHKLKAKMAVALSPFFIKKYGAAIIEPNMCMVTKRFVKKWHRRGIMINTYTANTSCDKDYLEGFPIAYTTNCPLSACIPDPSDELGRPKRWCKSCSAKIDE